MSRHRAVPSGVLALATLIALGTWVSARQAPTPQFAQPPTDSWPTYHGDYSGRHYSPLTQITASNVNQLELLWSSTPEGDADEPNSGGAYKPGDPYLWFAPAGGGGIGSAMPIVMNGRIYISGASHAWALDAYTGQQLWHYYWRRKGGNPAHRGMAVSGNYAYFETPDCYLVSLDARTGEERWHSEIADIREFRFCGTAPVVIKNHVITGMGGDGMDSQGWLSSFDAETGKLQWRWYTTPQSPSDPGWDTWQDDNARTHANGMPWQMATYDPDLNLAYITTGNPNPVFAGESRKGDNAYTNSVAALDLETGKMAWYFQLNRHETHDWDTAQVPVLIDGEFQGRPRKMLGIAAANGYFFLLDRATGQNLMTKPYTERPNNTVTGIDSKGMLINDPKKDPTAGGVLVYPGKSTNWYPPSYSPQTGLFYVQMGEGYATIYLSDAAERAAGWAGIGSGQGPYGRKNGIKAIDYKTGTVKWTIPEGGGSGLLSTAGGVLFGSISRYFGAFDAGTGKVLWRTGAIGTNSNGPATFMLDGKQIVLVVSGGALHAFVLVP